MNYTKFYAIEHMGKPVKSTTAIGSLPVKHWDHHETRGMPYSYHVFSWSKMKFLNQSDKESLKFNHSVKQFIGHANIAYANLHLIQAYIRC
jgi:hypothetical protein